MQLLVEKTVWSQWILQWRKVFTGVGGEVSGMRSYLSKYSELSRKMPVPFFYPWHIICLNEGTDCHLFLLPGVFCSFGMGSILHLAAVSKLYYSPQLFCSIDNFLQTIIRAIGFVKSQALPFPYNILIALPNCFSMTWGLFTNHQHMCSKYKPQQV